MYNYFNTEKAFDKSNSFSRQKDSEKLGIAGHLPDMTKGIYEKPIANIRLNESFYP